MQPTEACMMLCGQDFDLTASTFYTARRLHGTCTFSGEESITSNNGRYNVLYRAKRGNQAAHAG